jgi:two-component system chemotaxis response regulator CheY
METKINKKRILAIDDYPSVLVALEYLLGALGYEVVCASSGKAGLEVLAAGGVDLVVVDFDMPEMTGEAVCRQIRSTPALERLPVLIASGILTDERAARIAAVGASGMLVKPFDFEKLRELVASLAGSPTG